MHIQDQFEWLPGDWYVVVIRGCLPLGKNTWCYYDVSEDRKGSIPAAQRDVWKHLSQWMKLKTRELGADSQQVYLAGFSQGAMIALAIGILFPETAQKIVVCSGKLPNELKSLTWDAAAIGKTNFLILHGTQDKVIPVSEAREAQKRLNAIQARVIYQEYDCNHEMTPAMRLKIDQFWGK